MSEMQTGRQRREELAAATEPKAPPPDLNQPTARCLACETIYPQPMARMPTCDLPMMFPEWHRNDKFFIKYCWHTAISYLSRACGFATVYPTRVFSGLTPRVRP